MHAVPRPSSIRGVPLGGCLSDDIQVSQQLAVIDRVVPTPLKHVFTLVFALHSKLEVADLVVAPVTIQMMNLKPFWDRAIVICPNAAMKKALGVVVPARLIVSTSRLNPVFLLLVDNKLSSRHARSLRFV